MDRGLGRMRGKPQESGTMVALLESGRVPPESSAKKRKLLRVCVWAWRALRRDLRRQAQSQGGGGEAEGCPDARGFWGPTHILRPAGKRLGNGRFPSPRRSSQKLSELSEHDPIELFLDQNFEDIFGSAVKPGITSITSVFAYSANCVSPATEKQSFKRMAKKSGRDPSPPGKGKDKPAISLR